MTTVKNNRGLIASILFASILVSAALVYAGYSFTQNPVEETGDLNTQIEEGIENYFLELQEEEDKAKAEANKPKQVDGVSIDDDAILGDKDAPVTIIEFSDYECPFCKRHFTQVFPKIKENYIDTGKARLIFRDFPLGFHDPLATQQAIAAECAREQGGDETYFEYHDLIFENTTSNGNGMEKSQLYDLADELSLNQAEFKDCLDSEKFKEEVAKDLADGGEYGITGTPGFFVNGWIIKGAVPYESFEKIIEQELAL